MAESAKVVGRSESLELADLLREPDEGGARGAEIERKKLFPDSFFEDIANDPDAGSTLPKGGRPRKLLLYRSPGKQRRLHMVRDSHLSAQSLIVLPETHTREAPGKEEWDNTLEYLALQECVAEVQPKKRPKLPYDEEPQTRFFKAKGPPTEEDLKRATRAARRATFGTNGQKGFNRIFYEVHILERKAVEDGVSAQRRAGTGKNAGASIFAAAGAGAAQSNPVLGSGSARLAAAQLSADMAEWHCDVHKDIPWGDIPTLNTADGLKHVDAVAAIQRGERITSLWVPKKFGKNFHDDEDLWADVPEEEPDFEETKMKSGHFSMGGMHEMGKVETGEMDEEVAAGAAGGEEEDEDTAGLLGDDDEFQDEESQRAEQRVRRNMHDYQFGSGVTSGAMHALQAKARRRTLLRVVTGWYNYTENQALQSDVFAFVKLWRMKCVWKRLYRDTIEEKRAREEEERKKREQEERHVQLEEERARSFEEQRLREMEEAEDEAEQARLRMLMERDEELKKLGEQAKAQVELERQQKQLMAEEFAQHQKNKAGVAQEFPKGAEPLRDYLGGSSPGLSAGSGEDGRGEEDDLDLLSDGSDGEDRLLLGFSLGAAREGEKRRRSKDRTVVTDRNTFERYIAEERDTVLADDGKQLFK